MRICGVSSRLCVCACARICTTLSQMDSFDTCFVRRRFYYLLALFVKCCVFLFCFIRSLTENNPWISNHCRKRNIAQEYTHKTVLFLQCHNECVPFGQEKRVKRLRVEAIQSITTFMCIFLYFEWQQNRTEQNGTKTKPNQPKQNRVSHSSK